jgi:hypothetical protein
MNNPYTPPQASLEAATQLQATPPLWNPNVAACLSLFFSPVFGAILHMKNWQALGRPKEAAASKKWAIFCGVAYGFMTVAAISMPESAPVNMAARLGGLVLLLAWYAAVARSQVQFIAFAYDKSYTQRGWLQPVLYAVLANVGLMVIAFVVAFSVAAIRGAAN